MKSLRCTLVADGPSDEALLPILNWLLRRCQVAIPFELVFSDFRHLRSPPRGLADRIREAIDLYPCDLLFVHRDAESEPAERRFSEIKGAENVLRIQQVIPPVVCVVPVRMTEALLLFDERAIRRAAGNPNGSVRLDLPRINECERIPDPKAILHDALRVASQLTKRRLKKHLVTNGSRRVAGLIDDFEPLRDLSAIRTLESDLSAMIRLYEWDKTRV
jgi:hypothetical protein